MRRLALARPAARRHEGRRHLATLLRQARFEVLPTPSIVEEVLGRVPRDVTVTVTASPRKGLGPTLSVAEELAGEGYTVAPHLSARLIRDAAELREIATRLQRLGIGDVFVPAGDADPPVGVFDGALPVLVELAQLEHRFSRVGITGYPETHPQISDDVTIQSMWDKRNYADYIVSNLCFEPATLREWIRRIRARGVTLPLYLGLAGPADPARLLDMARKIGVSESARFAGKHLRWMAKLGATPGGYEPNRLVERLASVLSDPELGVVGVHVFTFNQLAAAESWRQALIAQAI